MTSERARTNDRDQILDDEPFWDRLEYMGSHWLERSDDRALRRFWIDGFLPEALTNTKHGADVEGTVWVGEGSRIQHPYRFVASIPQKMIHRRRQTFTIERLVLDERRQILQIVVAHTPSD
jgi:hypothetical protein